MKAVKIENFIWCGGKQCPELPVKCPVCNCEEGVEILSIYAPPNQDCNIEINSELQSIWTNTKTHITGNFCFCTSCKEIFFVYMERDTRTCNGCKHLCRVEFDWNCNWFKRNFKGVTLDNTTHCKHIDEEIPKRNYDPKCGLCEHFRNDNLYSSCNAPVPYHLQSMFRTEMTSCEEFKPSYKRYKEYRKQFETLLFDTDSIHIPEFDERIKQEKEES